VIVRDLGEGSRSAQVEPNSIRPNSSRQAALARLYQLTAARLMRYGESLTKNLADAEDAVQSALMRVAKKPQLLADARQPWAYLVRVLRNEALKIIDRRDSVLPLSSMLYGNASPEQNSKSEGSECPLEAEESRQHIQQAVRKLPTEQSEVVVLKIWEGFTFAEIADLVGESPNTVASRYRYALEKLTKHLQSLAEPHVSFAQTEEHFNEDGGQS
jgi:RNA polymerase sigma-70 factor (ECF subfamily)